MEIFPRISGRLGQLIDLNVTFYQNGVPTDPFAIVKVQIYKSAVQEENLVAEIPIMPFCDPSYPSPITRELADTQTGDCGTAPPVGGAIKPGVFHLNWDVPATDIETPDIFFDVWTYIPISPFTGGTADGGTQPCNDEELAVLADEGLWQKSCNEFWLYPAAFHVDTGLQNLRFGFEPMDLKFMQPEKRIIEVGIMPLPLYDFPYNKVAPLVPLLKAYFTLQTESNEIILLKKPMKIGLRMGTYRTNPFTLQYLFDTSIVLKGSYKYKVEMELPNGESRVSPEFIVQVG